MALELNEWEIWHTYTTYLDSGPLDLQKGAESLLESGVALCAMQSTGRTYWRTDDGIGRGITNVDINAVEGSSSFTLVRDEQTLALPDGFALEAWGQAAYFVIGEQRVLGDSAALSDAYIRAYLGKCVVTKKSKDGSTSHLNLYPVLIVYESGVVILEFRMIGPNTPVDSAKFIDGGVNLFRESFSQVEVNPGLARSATTAYYRSSRPGFFQRVRMLWLQGPHDLAIQQRTKEHADDDFSFELSRWSGQTDDLRSIALTIFHTCAFLIIGPRKGSIVLALWSACTARFGSILVRQAPYPPHPVPGSTGNGNRKRDASRRRICPHSCEGFVHWNQCADASSRGCASF
jgi:hypothetical protein